MKFEELYERVDTAMLHSDLVVSRQEYEIEECRKRIRRCEEIIENEHRMRGALMASLEMKVRKQHE